MRHCKIVLHFFYMQVKRTPLHNSAKQGYVYVTELLINAQADINAITIVSWYTKYDNCYMHICVLS